MTRARHSPVLLDLDGTVVDSAPAIVASIRAACDAVGVPVAPDADLTFCLGPPLNSSLARLGVPDDEMIAAIAVFDAHQQEHGLEAMRPMPGAVEVLDEIRDAGVPAGIVTLKPTNVAMWVIDGLRLDRFFATVLGRVDDFDTRSKGDLLREALDEPGLAGPAPLYVGDQSSDEDAARENGVPFLCFPDVSWPDIRRRVLG